MKYYAMHSHPDTQNVGPSQGHFVSYAQKTAKAYRVANEPTADAPNPLNNFGFMFRDKDLSIAGVTALGNKKTNEDRFSVALLPAHTGLLSADHKMTAMKAVAHTLGNRLLCDDKGLPCHYNKDTDEDDTRQDRCIAKGSGSTLAGVMIDDTGITISNVGDSYVLGVIAHANGEVNVIQLNTLDTINAKNLENIKLDNRPPSATRGTVGGLQFARAFGDIQARDSGVVHVSTESHYDYHQIPGYNAEDGDRLFIVAASDGLIDAVPADLKAEYVAAHQVFVKSKKSVEDLKEKYDAFDIIDQKKHDLIYDKFSQGIKIEIKGQTPSEKLITVAMLNTLAADNKQDLATLPDNLVMIVASAGPLQTQSLLIAIYDGHGWDGHITADFLASEYPQSLSNQLNAKVEALNKVMPENRYLTGSHLRTRVTTSGETTNATPTGTGSSSGSTTPVGHMPDKPK